MAICPICKGVLFQGTRCRAGHTTQQRLDYLAAQRAGIDVDAMQGGYPTLTKAYVRSLLRDVEGSIDQLVQDRDALQKQIDRGIELRDFLRTVRGFLPPAPSSE